ncbi:MAG: gliding motility-associated C-terminal domain-containing protein [Saprospiraceae bacterium]|nr:gliding motility-associated C-terminal domain-containing protein [Saprospiraceae bacterium]
MRKNYVASVLEQPKNLILTFCICFIAHNFLFSQNNCCCGVPAELSYPNLDFESPPMAPSGGWIDYIAGDNYNGWNITSGSISIHDPGHLNLGAGNPNGSTQHMDLHGFNQGSASYTLTGLTAGNIYTISFWYAIHSFASSVSARLTVNGGSLLNVSWNASNPGDVIWLSATYNFTANGSTAIMEFIGSGSTPCCGMLIDDIQIFECPADLEVPVVLNPPEDLEVECEKDIPKIMNLMLSDNCDLNPSVSLKETIEIFDLCFKKITRKWTIKDACDNITIEDQVINIIDKNPPEFTKDPETKIVFCDKDVIKEFNDWINKHGNSLASDLCGLVSWRNNFERVPKTSCDTILSEFIAIDHCGKETSKFASFIVRDTSAPKFTIQAQSKNYVCIPNTIDSLRNWLKFFGFSKVSTDCDTVILSSNFNGDTTKNPLIVTFYAKDRCGNSDSTTASFLYRSNSDTFRITEYSCAFTSNTIDTNKYTVNGCDSIVIHQKIKRLSDSTLISLNTCNPNQKLSDTIYLLNSNGCDSVIFYQYQLNTIHQSVTQNFSCLIQNAFNDTIIVSGQFCDSLLITEHIPLPTDSIMIQNFTCDSTKQGVVVTNFKNNFGCDSIVTVNTIFTAQQITQLLKQECGLSKNYIDTTIFNVGNCDSLVITSHIALRIDSNFIQSATCDPSKTGFFTKAFLNQLGCDSIVIETILLNPSDSVFISKNSCLLSQAGTITLKLSNRFGCDSIIQTTTSFIPADTLYLQLNTCNRNNVRIDTTIFTTATCDSLVITDIRFTPADTNISNLFTCNPSNVGIDTLIFTTKACDSVVFQTTTLLPSDTTTILMTSCLPAMVGLDTLILNNTLGCDSVIFMNTSYAPLRLNYQLDSIHCFNQNDGAFKILNSTDFGSPFEIYFNNTILTNQNQIHNLVPGTYEVFVKDNQGCLTDSVLFTLENPTELITDLGNDLEVKQGTSVQLNLQSNRNLRSVFWQPSNISNCVSCNQINVIIDLDSWIYTLAIDDRNCSSLDSIFIRVKKSGNVFAPNVFSPNGDNINDYFYIQGFDQAIVEILFIYDRWGNKLFETHNVPVNDPSKGWNGKFVDKQMNPGVYIYYAKIKINNEFLELIGDLSLIK